MKNKFALFVFAALAFFTAASYAPSAVRILEEIPVQHKGRIKPFQSFARESALRIIGSDSYKGKSASELVWLWMAKPEDWSRESMIPVTRMLREDFPMMLVKGRLSAEVILQHESFIEKVKEAWQKRKDKERLTVIEKERLDFYDRANLFHEIATGSVPGFIAHPENSVAAWLPFQALSTPETQQTLVRLYPEERLAVLAKSLSELIETLRAEDAESGLMQRAKNFRGALNQLFESQNVFIDPNAFRAELLYNRMHAFSWAWKLYLVSVLFFVIAMNFPKISASAARTAVVLLGGGFLIHLAGFVLRCIVAGRPPVTNMYESIIWVSFAAVFFSIILFSIYRNYLIPVTSSCVAAFALILAESFPALLDPSIAPLVPVLRSNMWLTVHVLTITMSYGAFALAWGLGHAVVIGYVRKPFDLESRKALSSYLYRALQIGVILLATGTVLGGVWANYSWGRFWGWDPKETWALIALLGYLVVLHGRFTGWLDSFGAAAASVIAFTGVVMAWYGVNFVLAAGLHSYGFGGGGAPYVVAVALADLALILALTAVYRRKVSQGAGLSAQS